VSEAQLHRRIRIKYRSALTYAPQTK
jgi:hypothetical protein